jgi:hypothetical protein
MSFDALTVTGMFLQLLRLVLLLYICNRAGLTGKTVPGKRRQVNGNLPDTGSPDFAASSRSIQGFRI